MQTIEQLIFVGLNGYAVALDRDSGEIVWSNNDLKSGFTTLMLDGNRLIVSTGGHIFALDPLTGEQLWYQPMSGYGSSTSAALLSVRGTSSQTQQHQQAQQSAQQKAAASAAAGS